MRVSTGDGETTIQSGKKIFIAQNEEGEASGDETGTSTENKSGKWRRAAIVGGVIAAGVAAFAIASSGGSGGGGGGGGGDDSSSPSSP